MHPGLISEHFAFRLPDAVCAQVRPDEATHDLEYEFGARCFARALTWPEHEHSGVSFHPEGLARGETTLRLRLVEGERTVFISPPIPVHVVPSASPRAVGDGERVLRLTDGSPVRIPRRS